MARVGNLIQELVHWWRRFVLCNSEVNIPENQFWEMKMFIRHQRLRFIFKPTLCPHNHGCTNVYLHL